MAKKRKPLKNEAARRERQRQIALQKQREKEDREEMDFEELPSEEEAALLGNESDDVEDIEKHYYPSDVEMPHNSGAVTFDQLDEERAARKKASKIREETWSVQDLVRNIVNNPMLEPGEKATFIKQAGNDFGDRVSSIMDTPVEMLKESDLDLLEVEALIAQDEREAGTIEKVFDFVQKTKLTSQARTALPDSSFAFVKKEEGKTIRKYPIHDKAHVRNALARVAQVIKKGGEDAKDARAALPKIRAAAKKMGIETKMEKGKSGIMVQKDAQGDWRWVGWPSNNFIDKSSDILTKTAHLEYVEHWNKSRDTNKLPIFTTLHAPGTAREHPVDFVGYENGFLVMSGKLTQKEAALLLNVQKEQELGMSHTGWGTRSDVNDARLITKYRLFEVTDLPIKKADNPFTALSVISKEAVMSKKEEKADLEYLIALTGSEELAKEALLMKTSLKQAALQEAGVEQKETEAQKTPETAEQAPGKVEFDLEAIAKELGMDDLSETIAELQKSAEKVPLLEALIKSQQEMIVKLGAEGDEKLADLLSPPAEKRFSWSKEARSSQSDKTLAKDDDLEKLKKTAPGLTEDDWLSEVTGTVPVNA